MNGYQKKYIEQKDRFTATDGGPESVRTLYAFKDELEADRRIDIRSDPQGSTAASP